MSWSLRGGRATNARAVEEQWFYRGLSFLKSEEKGGDSVSSGIFRRNIIGELEEIQQEQIDYWCSQCQFPFGPERCRDKALIQKCWDEGGAVAGRWHIQHESPFIHKGERCRCNDFKTIEDAFRVVGLKYKTKRR